MHRRHIAIAAAAAVVLALLLTGCAGDTSPDSSAKSAVDLVNEATTGLGEAIAGLNSSANAWQDAGGPAADVETGSADAAPATEGTSTADARSMLRDGLTAASAGIADAQNKLIAAESAEGADAMDLTNYKQAVAGFGAAVDAFKTAFDDPKKTSEDLIPQWSAIAKASEAVVAASSNLVAP